MALVPHSGGLSFRQYILTRKYHHGRGSDKGWSFIVLALGDPDLANVQSWHELREYLTQGGADRGMLEGAGSVWRSYISCLSRKRKLSRMGKFDQRSLAAYAGSSR
ncbi:MAG: hypothetical protein M3Q08_16775 [Pseudomonadota bacterium]|nr:hypothetical protein [Pseudomonadota bacterium]